MSAWTVNTNHTNWKQ